MKKLITIAALALAAGTAAAQTNDKGGHRGVDFGIGTGSHFILETTAEAKSL